MMDLVGKHFKTDMSHIFKNLKENILIMMHRWEIAVEK